MVADPDESGEQKGHLVSKTTRVVEQRVSNLAQGLLTLATATGPLLVVLGLIPRGVLAGLFFVMGVQALEANGITAKLLFLLRDAALPPSHRAASFPLKNLRRRAVWGFVIIELAAFGAAFAITQTVAAAGFPVIILLLIPLRAVILPRFFTTRELAVLDAPTSGAFTMESVGGIIRGDPPGPSGSGRTEDKVGGYINPGLDSGNVGSPAVGLFVDGDDTTAVPTRLPSKAPSLNDTNNE
jgi:hypothetical protein